MRAYSEKILEPYRSNVRNRDLIAAALELAEEFSLIGPRYVEDPEWNDRVECQICLASGYVTRGVGGGVTDVEEIEHVEGCTLAAYERARDAPCFFIPE